MHGETVKFKDLLIQFCRMCSGNKEN